MAGSANNENYPPDEEIDVLFNEGDLPVEKEVLLPCEDDVDLTTISVDYEDIKEIGSGDPNLPRKRRRNYSKGTKLPFTDKQLKCHTDVLLNNIGEQCRRGETKVAVLSVHPNGSLKCYGYSNIVTAVLRSNLYTKILFNRDSQGNSTAFLSEDPVHFPILKSYCRSELDKLSTQSLNELLLVLQTSLDPSPRKHLYSSHNGIPLEKPWYWPPEVDYRSQYGNENILHQKQPDGAVFESRKQALIYIIEYVIYAHRTRLLETLGVDSEGDELDGSTQTDDISLRSISQQTDDHWHLERRDARNHRFRLVKGGYKVVCGCDPNMPRDPTAPLNIHVCRLCNIRCHTLCCEQKCLICQASPCKPIKIASKL